MSDRRSNYHIDLDFSEEEIEVAVKNNDEKIIRHLSIKLAPDVSYAERKWSASEEDVWDNYQRTWEVAIIKIKTGKYKKGNFVGYFKTISNNIWLKFVRDRKHYSFVQFLFDDFLGETEQEQNERLIMDDRFKFIAQCKNELSDSYKKIIDMYYTMGMSHKQIAVSMGIKEDNARQKKYDSIQKLRTCVRKFME